MSLLELRCSILILRSLNPYPSISQSLPFDLSIPTLIRNTCCWCWQSGLSIGNVCWDNTPLSCWVLVKHPQTANSLDMASIFTRFIAVNVFVWSSKFFPASSEGKSNQTTLIGLRIYWWFQGFSWYHWEIVSSCSDWSIWCRSYLAKLGYNVYVDIALVNQSEPVIIFYRDGINKPQACFQDELWCSQ